MKPETKLAKIVRELNERAESENAHSMGGLIDDVAEAVTKHAGIETAIKVMQDISWGNYF